MLPLIVKYKERTMDDNFEPLSVHSELVRSLKIFVSLLLIFI